MLVIVHEPCNNFRNTFLKKHFSVSKEWVKSWSHAFLIAYIKTFAKKLNENCILRKMGLKFQNLNFNNSILEHENIDHEFRQIWFSTRKKK